MFSFKVYSFCLTFRSLSQFQTSLMAHLVKKLFAMQETLVQFLGQEELLEKGWAIHSSILGLPCGSGGKESTCNAGDLGSIPGLETSSREENGNPLQNSCPENPIDRGAWWATVHGVTKSRKKLSN